MCRLLFILLILLALPLTSLPASAATGYVTDQLVLTLRSASGDKYQALDHLKTATQVKILDEQGALLRIRTMDGKEGFVLKQYITTQVPKQQVIARQKKELQQLQAKMKQLSSNSNERQQALASLQQQRDQLDQKLQQSRQDLKKLTEEHQQLLDASQNLLQITRERDQLREENNQLATEATRLEEENSTLLTTGSIKWFLAGAGVLFFGWFMGKISRKKRRSF